MFNSADELLALTQSKQEEWFQSHLKEQFIQSLMDCPIVAMSVQIDDVHKELVSNLIDYNHGHEFIQSEYVSQERKGVLENGGALTEEEKLSLRRFLANDLVHDEIFDNKITVARWLEIQIGKEKLGVVYYGSDSPQWGSSYDFLGIFKTHEEVRHAMVGGELVDPKHHYDLV